MIAPWARADETAKLITYKSDDGQTSYALSLTPPASAAVDAPCDVVILFDTSASQTGAISRDRLAALEAAWRSCDPAIACRLLAADSMPVRSPTSSWFGRQRRIAGRRRTTCATSCRSARPTWKPAIQLPPDDSMRLRNLTASLYIGDGMSTANLLGSASFGDLIQKLRDGHIPVSSYAIGPRLDGVLLATWPIRRAETCTSTKGWSRPTMPQASASNGRMQKISACRQHRQRRLADWTRASRESGRNRLRCRRNLATVYPKQIAAAAQRSRHGRLRHDKATSPRPIAIKAEVETPAS